MERLGGPATHFVLGFRVGRGWQEGSKGSRPVRPSGSEADAGRLHQRLALRVSISEALGFPRLRLDPGLRQLRRLCRRQLVPWVCEVQPCIPSRDQMPYSAYQIALSISYSVQRFHAVQADWLSS
jgi:hypothetical protein